jgi:hypothetical protein
VLFEIFCYAATRRALAKNCNEPFFESLALVCFSVLLRFRFVLLILCCKKGMLVRVSVGVADAGVTPVYLCSDIRELIPRKVAHVVRIFLHLQLSF